MIDKVADWQLANAEPFPWRSAPHGFREPYRVWIAEVMAQQTRLATVVPYFNRWIAALPSPRAVAQADEDRVLKLWEGLGYYQRALNIHRAAKQMVQRHRGQVPGTKEELLALPGIGRYTAGGILSLAFNQPEPAIDGNVVRLYSRLHQTPYTAQRKANLDTIDTHIRRLLAANPAVSPGLIAEGLMALGSKICKPINPDCPNCPVREHCTTYSSDSSDQPAPPLGRSPVKSLSVRHHVGYVLLTVQGGQQRIFLVRNRRGDMLGGLWGFPALPVEELPAADVSAAARIAQDQLCVAVGPVRHLGRQIQDYSHFRRRQDTYLAVCHDVVPATPRWEEGQWVPAGEIGDFALSRIDHKIAALLTENAETKACAD